METDQTVPFVGDAPPRPFAALLKQARKEADLTQEALAERAGVSVRRIRDLERGAAQRPRVDTVTLLADALGLPLDAHATFIGAARRPPRPCDVGVVVDDAPAASAVTTVLTTAAPPGGASGGRWMTQLGRPLVVGALGALIVLVAGVAWARGPAPPPARPPGVVSTVVGPNQAACCWARRAVWFADGMHGYPGFSGPTYWAWAHGATRPPVSTVRWSFRPASRMADDVGQRRVAVDVWVPDNNADARVVYAVTDGRGRVFRRAVDQEFPAPGFVHRSPGWVRLGTFDGTRDGRRWGGLVVDLTDRASMDCAAYHYASRRCTVGAAQVRFSSPASGSL